MKVRINYAGDTPIISIAHYNVSSGEPVLAHMSGPWGWEVTLLRVQPRELIDLLLAECERIESEAIEAQRITIAQAEAEYVAMQEDYDRERYYEQKYG